jgi:RNA polymerase sigma-70 factor (ECF subfamily)
MSDLEAIAANLRAAHAEFAAVVESLRPELHRYCSRMTGSVLDGEDLVQETLAQACHRLTLTREAVALRPWLFTIAHHRCADVDERNEPAVDIEADLQSHQAASRVFSRLVLALPPRERAAIILKEMLEYSIPEIAAILETSQGAVKAALHRAREKIDAAKEAPIDDAKPQPAVSAYLDAFNHRDWARLQTLLEDEVQCELVGHVVLSGRDAVGQSYIGNYSRLPYEWKLVWGRIDGEPAIVCMRIDGDTWTPRHAVRLEWRDGKVARIRDYAHIQGLLALAEVIT